MRSTSSTVGQVWHQVLSTQPTPATTVVIGAAIAALLAVLIRDIWVVARNVVTIAHEGGHALVALLARRKLRGIKLHSDTSGVTLSRGKPTGPGMVATAAAGYVAPPLLGLGCAALLAFGHITALLWLTVLVLIAMLTQIRNAYGVASILITAAIVFAVSWFTNAQVQAAFAYGFMWFLVLGGIRPVWELQRTRSHGRARDSDADQLAKLTGLPGFFWVVVFGVVGLGVLVLTAMWLLPLTSWFAHRSG